MNEDKEGSAVLILENNRDTLIFWAVLVFTCVVGIIELLSEIKKPFNVQQFCIFMIYFVLLFVMGFSIWRVLRVYGENRGLALSGRLGRVL
jgi:uncharacterized membrane protein YkvI